MVNDPEDAKIIVKMIIAFAGDRKGSWTVIPACRKDKSDPLGQRGYLAFVCKKEGGLLSTDRKSLDSVYKSIDNWSWVGAKTVHYTEAHDDGSDD